MTNEEFDRRITRLTERHEALTESIELMRAETQALVERDKRRTERDRKFFLALADEAAALAADHERQADLFRRLADDRAAGAKNGDTTES